MFLDFIKYLILIISFGLLLYLVIDFINSKDSKVYEEWKEYDSNNNIIHFKNSNGYEE